MGQVDREIGELIQEIASKGQGKNQLRFPVMSGVVVAGSTDTGAMTCKVLLSVDDDSAPTEGIMITAALESTNGLVLYPADGSNVWVAEIDGPGKWGIVKCSDVVKVVVKINSTVLTIVENSIGAVIGSNNMTVTNNEIDCVVGSNSLKIKSTGFEIKAGGNSLKTGIDNLITHLEALTVTTAMGPSGPPINIADFIADGVYFDSILI